MPDINHHNWEQFDQRSFEALQSEAGVAQWDAHFIAYLKAKQAPLAKQLIQYRKGQFTPQQTELSEWLIKLSIEIEQCLVPFFGLEKENKILKQSILAQSPILQFKKQCVKKALKQLADPHIDFEELHTWLQKKLKQHSIDHSDMEWGIASLYQHLQQHLPDSQSDIAKLESWCRQAMVDPSHQQTLSQWASFALPERLDYMNMVPLQVSDTSRIDAYQAPWHTLKSRDGFTLTDQRMSARQSLAEADYCVDCHQQSGDFCATGFPVKKTDRSQGFRINPLGETLTGCPVEEKISEMHWLYKRGHLIAALTMIMRDNPLCALTGHRICNECMKSCIYQKQTPVNIPQAETSILSQVLQLPWGVELYDLLMRWNPLRAQQWCVQPHHGIRVLIMGMGPAGISLAHHLLMDGYTVVGMDGLKIEPLPPKLINQPIKNHDNLKESLSNRTSYGFGGVAEYGITVRWDKNFLKLIYIIMMRRAHFKTYGGIRFGGTIKVEDAWQLGFDHLAIAVGAGLPKALPIPHGLAPGVRQANDFLMALQLTGAFKKNALVNLQVQLPAVVIGGGLTGVDTATEVQAYYVMQVERMLERYEYLCQNNDQPKLKKAFQDIHPHHLDQFIAHGKAIKQERLRAKEAGERPCFLPLLQQWGGVTIVYRKSIHESPAYTRNHEELTQAMMEGIFYAEGLDPKAIQLDAWGHCSALQCQSRIKDESDQWVFSDELKLIPAKSIFIATGAQTNIAYAFEHQGTLQRNGFEYQSYQASGEKLSSVESPGQHCKSESFGAFTSYTEQGYRVSFLGDTHPVFHGNVVKAIASGKKIHPKIDALFTYPSNAIDDKAFFDQLDQSLTSTMINNEALTASVSRLTIHSPWLSKQHRLGQFYRLQNFEATPVMIGREALHMQALPLVPSHVDAESGLMQFLIHEQTASAQLCRHLTSNSLVSLMGPTGNSHKIGEGQTILFVGDFSSLIQLLALGKALKQNGNRLYWMVHPFDEDLVEAQRIHDLVEHIYTFENHQKKYPSILHQKITAVPSVHEAMAHCLQHAKQCIDRVYVSGSPELIKTIQALQQTSSTMEALSNETQWIANVNAPMQCMLKGVCAQCLVWQQDPKTKKRTKSVYACSWHHQPMAMVDPSSLIERKINNASCDKLNALWLKQMASNQ